MHPASNLFKKEALAHVFSCKICEIFKTPILHNICKRLLLSFHIREYTDQIRLCVLEYYTDSLSHSFPGSTLVLKVVTVGKILQQQFVCIESLASRIPG